MDAHTSLEAAVGWSRVAAGEEVVGREPHRGSYRDCCHDWQPVGYVDEGRRLARGRRLALATKRG